jgi:ABC-type amino acid transport substrate-binding protein
MSKFRIAAMVLAGVLVTTARLGWAAEPGVSLAGQEDWPPYSVSTEPHGSTEAVLQEAFHSVGYRLSTTFLPWQRALVLAKTSPKFAGVYPVYSHRPGCLLSAPIGGGPLGFVERRADPLTWQSLDDLAAIKIGTVAGYANTAEIDQRIKDGRLHVEEAPSDLANLRKLAAGRIRVAVIDQNVLNHLLFTDQTLATQADLLQFNAQPLEAKTLHVCFHDDAEGHRWQAILNEGLSRIDVPAVTARYFQKYGH